MEETDVNKFIKEIEEDEFYSTFLNPNAKGKVALSLSIGDQVKKLSIGIETIGKELQQQVLLLHNDLLQQAHHATKLENILKTMKVHVENLLANAERLKIQITEPYEAIEKHSKVLARLHLASHILRQVCRIQQLQKRLTSTNDSVQKATILQELEQLANDPDLVGINTVTSELRNIREQKQKIVKLANASLAQGISNENTMQTTTALQIFVNLGTINSAVVNFVDIALGECRESLKSTFNVRANLDNSNSSIKQGPGRVNLTSTQGFRERVWADLQKAFLNEISKQCRQIMFLQNSLIIINRDFDNVAIDFWKELGTIVTDEITNAQPSIQQMLEEDYPKLLKCYSEMHAKLSYESYKFNRGVLSRCENAYLSKCWARLLDPIQLMFSKENTAPSHEQIDELVRCIGNELSLALFETELTEKVSRNVSKCVRLFVVKTEQILATGPEASQVIAGSASSSQQFNAQLANSMYYLQTQIMRMQSNIKDSLSDGSINHITESISNLNALTSAILLPLIVQINETIETILITMHLETDWTKLPASSLRANIPCSPYMRELVQFISRVHPIYLSSFENKEVLSSKCGEILIRCIELMVRHASILRPISQGGRYRLQADFGYLENSLKILCPFLTDLGRPYRLFRSVATLITQTPEEIVASHGPESSVPHSTVLFLLFSFASSELASPHQNTGWSIKKLSSWLDEHTAENERLDIITGALQRYESIIRQTNATNFDPVYPIMSGFLKKAVDLL